MEKKNVVFLTVLAIATLLTAVVGTTFAYFTATVTGNDTAKATTVTTATVGVTYTDGSTITESNILPGWTSTKTITVKNDSSVAVKYSINWASVTNGFVDSTATPTTGTHAGATEFFYTYTKNRGAASTATAMPTADGVFVDKVDLASGATDTYVFTFNFANLGIAQNDNQGKTFTATFNTTVENIQTGA